MEELVCEYKLQFGDPSGVEIAKKIAQNSSPPS